MLPEIMVGQPTQLTEKLVNTLAGSVRRAGEERRPCAIALPGGSVATTFFPPLARALDWREVHFFWGDERCVPPDDPESNYRLAHELWLEPARVPTANVHRIRGEAVDAAEQSEQELVRVLGASPSLDVALLGVGPDGHVCSLFPAHPLLAEQKRFVAAIEDAPKPPPHRITLTLPALLAARQVVIAALGASKADALRQALEDQESPLPVARVVRGARAALVLMDPAAAGR
jgi:6-phosphogluconolactonase